MLYRVFDLGYSKLKSGIDDEPLQRLLHGHEVVSRQERFYVHDGLPHLVVSVLYRLATLPGSQAPGRRESSRQGTQQSGPREGQALSDGAPVRAPSPRRGKEKNEDWRALLREEDMPVFESLRAWRTQRARADAVPPYVIVTNAQLARIVSERPGSLTALKEIPGLGQSRLERFGKEILGVLADGVVPDGVMPGESASGIAASPVTATATT